MKYRSLYLLLPVLFIASYARAVEDAQIELPANLAGEECSRSLPDELRDEIIHHCNQPVKERLFKQIKRSRYYPRNVKQQEANIAFLDAKAGQYIYELQREANVNHALEKNSSQVLFDKLIRLNDQTADSVGLSFIGDNLLLPRNKALGELIDQAHLFIATLQQQKRNLTPAELQLTEIISDIKGQKTPTEVALYMTTLLKWFEDFEMTDGERNQGMSSYQKVQQIFTPEELVLDGKTVTIKYKHQDKSNTYFMIPGLHWGEGEDTLKIIPKSQRGKQNEHTIALVESIPAGKAALASIPQRAVRVVDETGAIVFATDEEGQIILQKHEGRIPLELFADLMENPYEPSCYEQLFKEKTPETHANRLLEVGKELATIKQQYEQEDVKKDPSKKRILAEQQQKLRNEEKKLLEGMKSSVRDYLTVYPSHLREQNKNLEASNKDEAKSIKAMQDHVAHMLLYVTEDDRSGGLETKEAIKKLFAPTKETARAFPVTHKDKKKQEKTVRLRVKGIDDETASTLANRVDEMAKLLNTTEGYIVEKQEEETKATPTAKKPTYASKAAKPSRQTKTKRKYL